MPDVPDETWRDLTLPMDEVLRVAWRMAPVVTAFAVVPFVLVWGLPSPPPLAELPAWVGRALLSLIVFGLVYLFSAVLHEALHALAMMGWAGIPWRGIHFGLRLREGVAYVHADRPMTVRAYRAVLAAPALVQGVLPVVAGVALGSGWVVAYGYVMLISSAGDVAILLLLRNVPPDRLVRDHPREVGCQVAPVRAAESGEG